MSEKTIWFKRKKYGIGWTPCTWQGWIITLCYPLLMVLPPFVVRPWNKIMLNIYYGFVFALTAGFFYLMFRFGESLKWSWGDDEKKK